MTEASLGDLGALNFTQRVNLEIDDACKSRFPEETAVYVTVEVNGETFQSKITTPRCDASSPPSWEERVAKFCIVTRETLNKTLSQRYLESFLALKKRYGRALQAGTVSVNCYGEGDMTTPFGSYKLSGFGGRDNSLMAHDQYTETKTIWIDLSGDISG